jgi:hypothetical protein
MDSMKYKELVNGIAACAAVEVAGKKYTGSYLAMIVAMNPNLPAKEAAETPQLICELGRLAAIAYRAKQASEVDYRIWRDSTVHRMTNDMEAAEKAGFRCVTHPGVDAKGKAKDPKMPATSAVEAWLRTQPEYKNHYDEMAKTEEAWSVVHGALDAARQRTWVVRTFAETGVISEATGDVGDAFGDNKIGPDVFGSLRIDESEGRFHRPPPPPVVRR